MKNALLIRYIRISKKITCDQNACIDLVIMYVGECMTARQKLMTETIAQKENWIFLRYEKKTVKQRPWNVGDKNKTPTHVSV